jgi:hypothetical protein
MNIFRRWQFLTMLAAFTTLSLGSHAAAQTTAQPNIVNNSSFENSNFFWTMQTGTTIDSVDYHKGSQSLKFVRTVPADSASNRQILMVQPGSQIQVDVWLKGTSLAGGTGKGARVFLESYTSAGTYINSYNLPVLSGTFAWTAQTGSYTVPSNADKVLLCAYMTPGTTGTAWFDDFEVRVVPPTLPTAPPITNAGFETASPLGWATDPEATRVTTDFRSGSASMRILNTTTSTKKQASQQITALTANNVYAGDIVHLSGWVKGSNLYRLSGVGSHAGVRIFADFSGTGWLGGMYPAKKVAAIQGGTPSSESFGWTQLKEAYMVPVGTTKITVGLQMMDGVNGTVYFDDISLQVEKRSLSVLPVYPNYRGIIHTSDTTDYSAKLLVGNNNAFGSGNFTVTQTLINVNQFGNLAHTGATTTPATGVGEHLITMNPPALSAGGYYWKIIVQEPGGYKNYFFIPIQVTGTMPDVYVDNEGWIRVKNGAVWDKFFIFGLYNQTGPDKVSQFDAELDEIAAAGFNTILDTEYGVKAAHATYVSKAAARGLKFIYNLDTFHPQMTGWWEYHFPGAGQENANAQATDRILDYRNHPNLLGWYLNDESPASVTNEVQAMYYRVKNLDPNHPTFAMMNDTTQLDNWYNTTDVIGIDKYPVNSVTTNIDQLYRVTSAVVASARGAKGIWAANQVCYALIPGSVPSVRYWPTQTEFRNQAYMALIAGAKSLIGWTYYDFDDIGTTTHTTNWPKAVGLASDIMGPNPGVSDLIKNGTDLTTVVQVGTINDDVRTRAFMYQGHVRIMVANAVYSTQQVTLQVPTGFKIATGQSTQYGTTGTLLGNQLTLSLPSVHSSTYRLVPI